MSNKIFILFCLVQDLKVCYFGSQDLFLNNSRHQQPACRLVFLYQTMDNVWIQVYFGSLGQESMKTFSIRENGEFRNFGLYIWGYHVEHIQLFPCSAMQFSLWVCLIFRALFIGEIWRMSRINREFRTCDTNYRPS